MRFTQVDCKVANLKACKRRKLNIPGDTGSDPPDLGRCLASVYPGHSPPALITVKMFESKASIIVCIITVTVTIPTFRRRFCTPDGNSHQTHSHVVNINPTFLWQVTF